MSIYRTLSRIRMRFASRHTLFKHGFNLSPMYRRTTARVTSITPDLCEATVRLPLSWRNRNYVGSIFGGSLYAAVDPIYMIQLIYVLGEEYVIETTALKLHAYRRVVEQGDKQWTVERLDPRQWDFLCEQMQQYKNPWRSERRLDIRNRPCAQRPLASRLDG